MLRACRCSSTIPGNRTPIVFANERNPASLDRETPKYSDFELIENEQIHRYQSQ